MKAIILAAGMGSRLHDVCKDKPKPLFEINGKSLLEYSLNSLNKAGIKQIDIVLGYKGEMIKEKIGENYKDIKIRYAENELYESTGSMHSVYCAFKDKEPEDCLVLDADLVYNPEIISNLLKSEKENIAFLTPCCGSGEETYVILDDENKIVYLSLNKKADRALIKKEIVWEFNGVAKFSKEFVNELLGLHKQKMENKDFEAYYEEHALEINKTIPWYGLIDNRLVLAEVDRKEDVERAEQVIKKLL